ncbi:MAG: SH3 domain-containing protein [Caldilineaceae bacterium]|nr:SH3 domain-containing protein [Caldilineaceae bacterium]
MRWLRLPTLLITVLFFAACGPRGASVEPALPTNTPVPTFTSTAAGPAPATGGGQSSSQTQSQPAATPVPPAATVTPEAPTVTIGNVLMNVRGGPGTNYNVIGTASPGQQFRITGKNPGLGDWWQIDYSGRTGWVFGQLVTATNAETVQVALVIPAPPPPTATPPPPTPVPVPTQPPAPRFPFTLVNQGNCNAHSAISFFTGFVRDVNNNPINEVCVHIAFHGPRNTKCTGCGDDAGAWGFTPFGQGTGSGTTVEIYVVNCPPGVPRDRGLSGSATGPLSPISEKWVKTLSGGQTCRDITFRRN